MLKTDHFSRVIGKHSLKNGQGATLSHERWNQNRAFGYHLHFIVVSVSLYLIADFRSCSIVSSNMLYYYVTFLKAIRTNGSSV